MRYAISSLILSLGLVWLWPMDMLFERRWQSFSIFMERQGYSYIGHGWWRGPLPKE